MRTIKGDDRVRNMNKKVLDTVRHLVANLCIKLNFCFFSLQLALDPDGNGQIGPQNYVLMGTNSNGNSTPMAPLMDGVGGSLYIQSCQRLDLTILKVIEASSQDLPWTLLCGY